MPAPARQLELDDARSLIATAGFGGLPGPADPRSHRTVGVELESFVLPTTDPQRLPAVALPAGSRLTYEPGGQVEVSSPPHRTAGAACEAAARDLAAVRDAFAPFGVDLVQSGLRPSVPPRLVDAPRYRAMEAYFASRWPDDGPAMMRGTASVQVNLGLGQGAHAPRRWRAANVLGPVLAAAFSSSPTAPAQGAGGCRRLATWLRLDPSRTAPVPARGGDDPGRAWARYALEADVMLIRSPAGCEPLTGAAMTLRNWIDDGHPRGWPTADDVAYHLTTLFPPVRPRGWLELRMIDALPDPWWRVPVAAAAVLLDDAEAVAACQPVADHWWAAAELGLADESLAAATRVCARRTLAGLSRVGVDMTTAVLVEQWAATVRKGGDPPWLTLCLPLAAPALGAAR